MKNSNPRKKLKYTISNTASIRIQTYTIPLISSTTQLPVNSIRVHPDRTYTIGRKSTKCQFVFDDRRVSKRHCQILFDAFRKKLYIADGELLDSYYGQCCSPRVRVRVSLNGVFVNGIRVGSGDIVELRAGDEVSLVCGNEQGSCSVGRRIGFVVDRVAFVEEVVDGNVELQDGAVNCMGELSRANSVRKYDDNVKTNFDGVGQLTSHIEINYETECCDVIGKNSEKMNRGEVTINCCLANYTQKTTSRLMVSEGECDPECSNVNSEGLKKMEDTHVYSENGMANDKPAAVSIGCGVEMDGLVPDHIVENNSKGLCVPPPGNKFYLNRLHFMSRGSSEYDNVVSLPDLLYPVKTIVRLFITTFTSDILWFLSYCEIPTHLPVTIACHNTGKCWSSSLDDRMSVPYSDYPNLIVVPLV